MKKLPYTLRFQFRLAWMFLAMFVAALGIARAKRHFEPSPVFPAYQEARVEAEHRAGRVVIVHLTTGWDLYSHRARKHLETPGFRRELAARNVAAFTLDYSDSTTWDTFMDRVRVPDEIPFNPSCALIIPRGPRDRDPILVCPFHKPDLDMRAELLREIDQASRWP
jgi:hypothetical protein